MENHSGDFLALLREVEASMVVEGEDLDSRMDGHGHNAESDPIVIDISEEEETVDKTSGAGLEQLYEKLRKEKEVLENEMRETLNLKRMIKKLEQKVHDYDKHAICQQQFDEYKNQLQEARRETRKLRKTIMMLVAQGAIEDDVETVGCKQTRVSTTKDFTGNAETKKTEGDDIIVLDGKETRGEVVAPATVPISVPYPGRRRSVRTKMPPARLRQHEESPVPVYQNRSMPSKSFPTKPLNTFTGASSEGGVHRFACSYCNQQFPYVSWFKRHLSRAHNVHHFDINDGGMRCGQCGSVFTTAKQLWQHRIAVHGRRRRRKAGSTLQTTPVAPLSSSITTELENHQEPATIPELTSKTFYNVPADFSSATEMHKLVGPDPMLTRAKYRCCCGKVFRHRVSFRFHVRTQTAGRIFQCPHCPIKFKVHSNVKDHVRLIHKKVYNPNNFGCGVCGKVIFPSMQDLKLHRREAHGLDR